MKVLFKRARAANIEEHVPSLWLQIGYLNAHGWFAFACFAFFAAHVIAAQQEAEARQQAELAMLARVEAGQRAHEEALANIESAHKEREASERRGEEAAEALAQSQHALRALEDRSSLALRDARAAAEALARAYGEKQQQPRQIAARWCRGGEFLALRTSCKCFFGPHCIEISSCGPDQRSRA